MSTGYVILFLGQRPEVPHVNPPRRRVRDVVGDAALLVLADGERAVVRPRQPRIPLIARRADIYQSAVERREARVADVVSSEHCGGSGRVVKLPNETGSGCLFSHGFLHRYIVQYIIPQIVAPCVICKRSQKKMTSSRLLVPHCALASYSSLNSAAPLCAGTACVED